MSTTPATVIGTVGPRDFDRGVVTTLGGEVVLFQVDGETRGIYAVAVDGVKSKISYVNDKVPIFFMFPEDVYQEFKKPSFVVRKGEMTPAFDRQEYFSWVARGPAAGAKLVTLPSGDKGYDKVVSQWRGNPFDITYDVQILGRLREEAECMLMHALRIFLPPSWPIRVVDSLGEVREYDAVELGVSDTSELADVADRTCGYTLSFVVRGEIDLVNPVESKTFLGASSLPKTDPLYSRYDIILRSSMRKRSK